MTLLAINWAEVGIKAGQFILSISIIVILHELGHFLTAKWFKCRVEKFYLFFPAWFSLFKKQIGETEYGIGWIPFGGFVKISGMIDESMDKEQMKLPPEPYEFRSKPAWQRLIIMVAGVVVNLILGFLIYSMMAWHWGDSYIPTDKLKYGIATDSLSQSIGLRDGDQILSVDGKYIEKFKSIPLYVILNGAKNIEVKRGDQNVTVQVPDDFAKKVISYKDIGFISVRMPFEGLDSIEKGSVADKIGLMKGDKILSLNGEKVFFYSGFRSAIKKNMNKPIDLVLIRGTDTIQKTAQLGPDGKLGIYPVIPKDSGYEVKNISYTFAQSIPAGFSKSVETLKQYWLQLKLIFSGKVNTNESLGSVISFGKLFAPVWDWQSFWGLTAFFSLILSLLNILPIPALDGGHALFVLIEMITGRKPSDKFIEYAQMAGMVLLLSLMVYALGLDIFRLFK
ncbi:MAG: RIP metalloprotease RseP [Bacteroidetes bacterium]|nr:RIP metalloprotease RseP [Bacteroidota bacterium]